MKKPTAITMGDPLGIGPEIILGAFRSKKIWKEGIPLVIGDYSVLKEVGRRLYPDIDVREVNQPEEAEHFKGALPVLDMNIIPDAGAIPFGTIDAVGGRAAAAYIEKAVDLSLKGRTSGIATAPINKESLRAAGYQYIGHTEMLAELSKSKNSVTMFTVDKMKIFFHSRHLSLRKMLDSLTVSGVTKSLLLADACMRSLTYDNAKIALAALNPHASDGGLFGDEEREILLPAVREAQSRGVDVHGPVPADSVFHQTLIGKYDAVVSLYHDQGHIASKTYDFHRTISVTLALPFIRTSVDHGTALDIAWKGIADPVSMEAAILSCYDLSGKYTPFSE